RKGSGGNGGIASGEDSGHASCGGSAAEGRRPRPAGKALTKEMFGSPAQGGGVADASNAVYCEGTTGSLNEGDVGVTAAVEVANG
ncbi:unnamed protein product, partial [Sphacelaria rigidula]